MPDPFYIPTASGKPLDGEYRVEPADSNGKRSRSNAPSVSEQIAFMQSEAEQLVKVLSMASSVAKLLEQWSTVEHAGGVAGEDAGNHRDGARHQGILDTSVRSAVRAAQRVQREAMHQLLRSSSDATRQLYRALALALRGMGEDQQRPLEDNLRHLDRPGEDREPRGLVIHLHPEANGWATGDQSSSVGSRPSPEIDAEMPRYEDFEDAPMAAQPSAPSYAPVLPPASAPQHRPLERWAGALARHYMSVLGMEPRSPQEWFYNMDAATLSPTPRG